MRRRAGEGTPSRLLDSVSHYCEILRKTAFVCSSLQLIDDEPRITKGVVFPGFFGDLRALTGQIRNAEVRGSIPLGSTDTIVKLKASYAHLSMVDRAAENPKKRGIFRRKGFAACLPIIAFPSTANTSKVVRPLSP